MILRFVQGTAWTSKLIIAQQKTAMPFTPSHVEAVTPDGLYLGAHMDGGVKERKPNYDQGKFAHELMLALPATSEQNKKFYDYLGAHLGEPYDWRAITGFAVPGHYHSLYHTICSALVAGALRTCEWFPFPLPAPWHLIDPRDLLLMISVKLEVPM
jgi:hypothetical protein